MSERLNAVKSLIVPAGVIADVGCDHGLIASFCAHSGLAERVIASDISEKCLQKAEKLLKDVNNVTFVCCDGIKYHCDEAIISGMGGLAITQIMNYASVLPQTVVVCPHRNHREVRAALIDLGYGLERDIAVAERGMYYSVMRFVRGGGTTELSELQLLFGLDCDKPNDALKAWLRSLHAAYMAAPEHNAGRLRCVRAAMRLQGIDPEIQH